MGFWLLIAGTVGVLIVVIFIQGRDERPRSLPVKAQQQVDTRTVSADLTDKIAFLQKNGVVSRMNVEMNEAHVNPLLWRGVNADAKRGIVMTLSQYFSAKGSTGRVKVLDDQSGRLLAESSSWSGVTLY